MPHEARDELEDELCCHTTPVFGGKYFDNVYSSDVARFADMLRETHDLTAREAVRRRHGNSRGESLVNRIEVEAHPHFIHASRESFYRGGYRCEAIPGNVEHSEILDLIVANERDLWWINVFDGYIEDIFRADWVRKKIGEDVVALPEGARNDHAVHITRNGRRIRRAIWMRINVDEPH